MKTGIVDVGGGLRGVYAAGVFDRCLDMGIHFDVCVGVSAGSANISSYIAGQKGRNYPFYTVYPFRKEYMSWRNFLWKRSYLDLDYIYGTLSNSTGENPLDFSALTASTTELCVVACDAETGAAKYFGKEDMRQNDYSILKASSAIPFVCRPYEVNGRLYYDGALGDPIPIVRAFQMGCDRVVLILSKPQNIIRLQGKDPFFAKRIEKRYPKAAEQLRLRADRYNDGVALAKTYEAKGQILIVAPDDTCGVETLTRDKDALQRLYEKGYENGGAIAPFLFGSKTGNTC